MSASEGRDPYESYLQINKVGKLIIFARWNATSGVANKMDTPEAEENLKEFKEKLAANYDEFDELPKFSQFQVWLARFGNLLEATKLLDEDRRILIAKVI